MLAAVPNYYKLTFSAISEICLDLFSYKLIL